MRTARSAEDTKPPPGVLVRIPPALRDLTSGRDEVLLVADDLSALLDQLDATFPGFRDRIADETGQLRRYVNVFVNDELPRGSLSETRLAPGDTVHILPSVAGG